MKHIAHSVQVLVPSRTRIMLRITISTDAKAAAQYYTQGLTRANYYAHDHAISGQWLGRGAARLGLSGTVEKKHFKALIDNQHPFTGEQLTPRQSRKPGSKKKRRVAYDRTFNAPKSLTLLYEYTRDERLLDAFRSSVRATMEQVERDARTQSGAGEMKKTPFTGNLTWAEFIDFEARPVQDDKEEITDPHLHAHCVVAGQTWVEDEERWKALWFSRIKASGAFYEAAFHARLSKAVRDLGYDTVPVQGGRWWEIAGISRRLREKFSLRTREIDEYANEFGITGDRNRDGLGARTRGRKATAGVTLGELRRQWRARLTDEDIAELEAAGRSGDQERITAGDALRFALDKALERSSAAERNDLLIDALRFGMGHVTLEELEDTLMLMEAEGQVMAAERNERTWLTTPGVAEEEQALCKAVREGMGTCAPFKPGHVFEPIAGEDGRLFELSEAQQAAGRHILESRDLVTAIRGIAGAGKTTLLSQAVAAIETEGTSVFTFAPTTAAAKVLQTEGFGNAATLQSLLVSKDKQARLKDGVILVDEAGLVAVPQVKRLMEIAQTQGARVVLVGDGKQHGSVERSDVNVLHVLERHAGLKPFTLSEIRRQEDEAYRSAVVDLSTGDVVSGLEKLEAMDAIREMEDDDARYTQVADDYLGLIQAGKEVLIVSPTHAEGAAVNETVRRRLKDAGVIGAEDHTVTRWRNLNATLAERRQGRYYAPGMMIEFVRGCEGFKAGTRLTVTGRDESGYVTAESQDGRPVRVPLTQAGRFQVYEERSLDLAVGDLVRLTKNGFGLNGEKLVNGTVSRIAGFTDTGDIALEDGAVLGRGFGHIASGYCMTSHASQGRTVDAVLVAQSSLSAGAASPEQLYVSVSRARETLRIYTDDREAMKKALHERSAMSTMDFIGENPEETAASLHAWERMMAVHRKRKARLGEASASLRQGWSRMQAKSARTLRTAWNHVRAAVLRPLPLTPPGQGPAV